MLCCATNQAGLRHTAAPGGAACVANVRRRSSRFRGSRMPCKPHWGAAGRAEACAVLVLLYALVADVCSSPEKCRPVTFHDHPRRAPVHLRPLRHLLLCRLPQERSEVRLATRAAGNKPASVQQEAESLPYIGGLLLHVRVSQACAWPGRDGRIRAAMRRTPEVSCCAERSTWRASRDACAVCLA